MVDLLAGGTALITGAGSGNSSIPTKLPGKLTSAGIGRATALCFARDGCHQLVLGDLSMNGLQETQRLLLDEYPAIRTELRHLDVGDEESVEEIYKSAVDRFGRIDFVANVAGYAHPAQPVTDITLEQYEKSVAVNIRGVSHPNLPLTSHSFGATGVHESAISIEANGEAGSPAGLSVSRQHC